MIDLCVPDEIYQARKTNGKLCFLRSVGERAVPFRRICLVLIYVFAGSQKRSRHGPGMSIRASNRGRTILRQMNAPHPISSVWPTAMKHEAVEGDNASCGDNDGITRVISCVTD